MKDFNALAAILIGLSVAMPVHTALAQRSTYESLDLDVVNLGSTPTTEQLIDVLQPKRQGFRTRGLKVKPDAKSETKSAVALKVNFGFGSSDLTQDAMSVLDAVGKALNSEQLSSYTFLIEGHTDAVGSDAFNQRLSERRAASVKEYLVNSLQIDGSRLKTAGIGEYKLLNPDDPTSSENRRVQIVNLQ